MAAVCDAKGKALVISQSDVGMQHGENPMSCRERFAGLLQIGLQGLTSKLQSGSQSAYVLRAGWSACQGLGQKALEHRGHAHSHTRAPPGGR